MLLFPSCKINLGLDVLRRRSDGFHDIETVMYPVPGLYDGLEIIRTERPGAVFTSSGTAVDCPPHANLVLKAYEYVRSIHGIGGVRVHLHKSIPSGAGLGGGSSDAAFTVRALNAVFALELDDPAMETIASRLGSDTPFFIRNQPRFCQGRGDIMSPAGIDLRGKYAAIVSPPVSVSTAEAYAAVEPRVPAVPLKERVTLPVSQWKRVLDNAFEKTVFALHPELARIKDMLYDRGAVYASMSGSGSSLFGIFDSVPDLQAPRGCLLHTSRL